MKKPKTPTGKPCKSLQLGNRKKDIKRIEKNNEILQRVKQK